MEFVEVLENVRREAESVDRFVEMLDGRSASPAALAEHQGERFGTNLSARMRVRRDRDPGYMKKLALFARTLTEARQGRRLAILAIEEAMGTSDFPLLFGDVLDRQMLGNYREWPRVYQNFMRVDRNVPDFRTVHRFAVDGAEGVFDPVNELAEYEFGTLSEQRYTYAVAKYGRKMAFSWESIINDDFNSLAGSTPARLGRGARRTENKIATSLYVDSSGPHASLYSGANTISGDPALGIEGLEAGINMLLQQVDEDGEPIVVEAVHLVVPTALEIQANQIVSTVQRRIKDGQSEMIVTGNGLPRTLQVHTDPYIGVVAVTNGDTSWFLFADPNMGRPALEMGFLRGHNEPELFVKEPNARRVGGGQVNPLDGDFDADGIQYKARHVVGGVRLDPRATVASAGTGGGDGDA